MLIRKLAVTLCVISFGLALAESNQWKQGPRQGADVTKRQASDVRRGSDVTRSRRSYDQWLEVLQRLAKRSDGEGYNSPWKPFPVDFPLPSDRDGHPVSLPVLILPVPVPVPGRGDQACSAEGHLGKLGSFGSLSSSSFGSRFQDNTDNNDIDTELDVTKTEPVTSDYLIQLFREQRPKDPLLPPAVIGYFSPPSPPSATSSSSNDSPTDGSSLFSSDGPSRVYLPQKPTPFSAPSSKDGTPPTPVFDRSVWIRGYLTVPRSDYTEPYTAWYDSNTGASRVEYHDGATMTFRSFSPDGRRVTRTVMATDRTGDRDMLRCAATAAGQVSEEDRAPPVLPDPSQFTFGGYKEALGGRVEVWKRELSGGPGELGAVAGESLAYHHELLVTRKGGLSVPLKYSVTVDSSVLGPKCDEYEHNYSEIREQSHDPSVFYFNSAQQCDSNEQLDTNNLEHMRRVDPIKEFLLPARDPRYDDSFEAFIKDFGRTFVDDKEKALRKNLMVQSTRFINSCNREGAPFVTEVNFLADRLEAELAQLLGVTYSEGSDKEDLSFSGDSTKLPKDKLPDEFDWRPLGGVTPVKSQESCSSCWAFAVTGSVEGALYIRTKQLIELSEQCLVDCAHSHGANGCKGTWPSHAYNYIKDRGQPARNEYTPYANKVLKCKAPPVPPVTHISGYANVPPNNTHALKVAIRRFAPSVVIVDANTKSFQFYKGGVLKDDRCIKGPKKRLNHAVLAVGWGEQRGEPHFIIKNSWSAAWAEGGYIRLHAPSNTCGHLTYPSFARLKENNIDRLPGDQKDYYDGVVVRDNE